MAKRPPKKVARGFLTGATKGSTKGSKGTFSQGTKSANSSNAGKNTNQRRGGGGGQRRDGKGRFA